ncbi:hypothetical protein BASA81_005330 [Batrachochytrium salamandrivorans]|nr:hypothetical protein BASA81_005330 [Batrachochytrium salamandrivorans]
MAQKKSKTKSKTKAKAKKGLQGVVKSRSNNPLAQVRLDALREIEEKKELSKAPIHEEDDRIPRVLVAKRGKVGRHAKELVQDLRGVFSPNTPSKLRETKSNSVKDYLAVAGILGLSHLMLISQTAHGPNVAISRIPRGPALSFKLLEFTPCSFLRKKTNVGGGNFQSSFRHSPLVVLNNFDNESHPRHVKIVGLTMQAMFQVINVKKVKLHECRRVLLINYQAETDTFDFRHYFVRADPSGASRSVRKLLKSKLPDLSMKQDVSEIIDSGVRYGDDLETSDSEMEGDNSVALPQEFPGRGNHAGKRSVVKLREIGPRMTLELVKVTDGVFDGEVQYHKYQSRSTEELEEQRVSIKEKQALTDERRRVQEANVETKKRLLEEKAEAKRLKIEARQQKLVEKAKSFEGGEAVKKHEEDAAAAEEEDEASSGEEEEQE